MSHSDTIVERAGSYEFDGAAGSTLRVDVLAPDLVRVRLAPDGQFAEALAVKWGFVRDDWPPVPVTIEESPGAIYLNTGACTVCVERDTLRVSLLDPAGQTLMSEELPVSQDAGAGPRLTMTMPGDEHFYGLGFQRMSLDARGHKLIWGRRFRHREATVPFFLSSRGYGFYSNNTWDHTFDFSGAGAYTIDAEGGQLDYFLFFGPSFRAILERYADLTGHTQLVPRWAIGLLYICRYFESQAGVLGIADGFRKHDIPFDMLGLEPGWENVPYDMTWQWSPERFPEPAALVRELAERGFVLEMWESGKAPAEGYEDPEVRRLWYQARLATSVDIGVKFFKQDDPYPRGIISEELQAPKLAEPGTNADRQREAELRNLSNTLYSETAMEEYRRCTGERTFFIFNGYNSSIASHRWPVTWAADFAAGCGMLNAALSGHAMVSWDMHSDTLAGIHYGYLVPFPILDAWAYYREPWLWPDYMVQAHRFYARLRHRLAPYLYSTLWQAQQTDVPMMRPMVLDYTGDAVARDLTTQYMLGDWLLVGLERQMYLPAGNWINYWTGERYTSAGGWAEIAFEEPAGGPLLVKEGALLPTKVASAYLEQDPWELIVLQIFPGPESTSYVLYEDDGRSFAYEQGAYATTEFSCERSGDGVQIDIKPRTGDYAGKPARAYLLALPAVGRPLKVSTDGAPLAELGDRAALLGEGVARGWWWDAAEGTVWIKPAGGWRLEDLAAGGGGPTHEKLLWTSAERPTGTVHCIQVLMPDESGWTAPARPEKSTVEPLLVPDRLQVIANPPERIALKWGDWLPHKTNLYVSICAGTQEVRTANNLVRMQVIDQDGTLIAQQEKPAERGRVEFLGVEYRPAEWTFRFTSAGLEPAEVQIRPAVAVPGRMFGPA